MEIPQAKEVIDPTGCGDALIAGSCVALFEHGWELPTLVRMGIHYAQACLACQGAQSHRVPTDVERRRMYAP